jgi:hypothetical protein
MAGILEFKTLADALRAGFHVYDRTEQGYLVRTRTARGWAMALVRGHGDPNGIETRHRPGTTVPGL